MKAWSSYREDGLFWFRIFDVGFSWKDVRKHGLLFTERHGYTGFRVGNWMFHFLPRCDP